MDQTRDLPVANKKKDTKKKRQPQERAGSRETGRASVYRSPEKREKIHTKKSPPKKGRLTGESGQQERDRASDLPAA